MLSLSFNSFAFATNIDKPLKSPIINIAEKEKEDLYNGKLSVEEFYKRHPEIKKLKEEDFALSNNTTNASSTTSTSGVTNSIEALSASALPYFDYPLVGALSTSFYDLISGSYGGNQSWNGGTINEMGCGAVSACNIMAYYAKSHGRSALYPYSWDKNGFTSFQNYMYYNYLIGPTYTISKMETALKNYALNKGYSFSSSTNSCWLSTSDTFINMLNHIKASIDSNNPVALYVGPDAPGRTGSDFSSHYVTVTGYNYSGSTYQVTVSSWGESYDLNLYDLIINTLFLDTVSLSN